MPSVNMVLEQCQWLIRKGRGNEKAHLVLIEQEAKKRIENKGERPKTRFGFETGDPELYSALHAEKERILRRCGLHKTIALTILLRAWERMSDAQIDKILSEEGVYD